MKSIVMSTLKKERITRMTPKGAALIMADNYENQADAKDDLKVRFRKALEKLYAYEELGLEPDEIADLLQANEAIRSKLNTVVTWESPMQSKSYISKLNAVEFSRDLKTDKLRLSAKLVDDKGYVVYVELKHVKEMKDLENNFKIDLHRT